MEMPESPLRTDDGNNGQALPRGEEDSKRPNIVTEGSGVPLPAASNKRSRYDEPGFHPEPPLKRLAAVTEGEICRTYLDCYPPADSSTIESIGSPSKAFAASDLRRAGVSESHSRSSSVSRGSPTLAPPLRATRRHIVIRDFMHRLVNDVLCNSHPVQKANTQNELGEVVQVSMEGPRGQVQDLTINLVVEPEVPECIVTEEQHLQFALQKVVDNAVKFTECGSITISVKMARNAQLVEIRIGDTGCGITEESKAHLFKPHFQEDASISRLRDGLGLSLFNAKAHVRKNLGGDMTLERSATDGPSKGSEFLIRLPVSAPPDNSRPETPLVGSPIPASHSREPHQVSPSGASKINLPASALSSTSTPRRRSPAASLSPMLSKDSRVLDFNPNLAKEIPLTFLVAEDNFINRQVLVGYLKKLGYQDDNIVLAFDGVEAVQQYRASISSRPAKQINAVLMDLWMPNMDGYEATERILKIASEMEERISIMAVTADNTSESLERAKQTGMVGFISKPYKALDIELLILEHFRKDNTSL
jgi:CheY-like chemotaxis protein